MQSDASLKGKVKALANRTGLKPQELLQMYLFEHLLLRLEKSDYAQNFVLKGGLLISSMIGVAQRTTMDMDTTVIGMSMERDAVEKAVADICAIDTGDGMKYSLQRVEPIRADAEYANWRAHLVVNYGKINAPIKIDITTGDSIVPGRIEYEYPLMLEDATVKILSYPLETILAEKLETVVSRGIANTRGRDYYDIYALQRARGADIRPQLLHEAVVATAEKRNSLDKMETCASTLEEVRVSSIMTSIWDSYAKTAPYAKGLEFDKAINAALLLAQEAGVIDLD